ncbi:uncharacterized protein LOC120143952 [Hibiscus syriacus]|uniref:uncharacterized protein LOC120143952 n=1 Tax=Hibiscus syriacus TaxID=106335 RepID=UPI001922F9DD|nr:uncharacterized protein LOC120143952 [Hibiscus syriacus]
MGLKRKAEEDKDELKQSKHHAKILAKEKEALEKRLLENQTQNQKLKSKIISCFTFGKVDLTPTIEECRAFICCPRIYEDMIYIKSPNTTPFKKTVLLLTGMCEEWATRNIKRKGVSECITWNALREVIYHHPDKRKQIDMLALGIYGLIIFLKILGHVDIAAVDLFERLNKNADLVPVILAETFRSLNSCRHEGEGRFIGCAPLLLVWILNHFKHEERAPVLVFLEDFSHLQDFLSRKWSGGYGEEKWMNIFQNLEDNDVLWRASWNTSSRNMYKCGKHDWVPLPGIWGLSESVFVLRSDQYKEMIRKVNEAWKRIHQVNLFTFSQKLSPKYEQWRINRINDNIPVVNFENVQPIKEHVRIIPSPLELAKQDFESERKQWKKKLCKSWKKKYTTKKLR